jgi:hypothetical protein
LNLTFVVVLLDSEEIRKKGKRNNGIMTGACSACGGRDVGWRGIMEARRLYVLGVRGSSGLSGVDCPASAGASLTEQIKGECEIL